MSNLLHRVGDEFAVMDKTGLKALFIWISILLSAVIFILLGSLHSSSWMIIVGMTLMAILLIMDLFTLLFVDLEQDRKGENMRTRNRPSFMRSLIGRMIASRSIAIIQCFFRMIFGIVGCIILPAAWIIIGVIIQASHLLPQQS